MNNDLQQRWRKGQVPFSGFTIAYDTQELLSLSSLRQALLAVVPSLQERWPQAELFLLNDWHEHDGYVNAEKPTSWQELFQMIEADEAIKKFSTGEWEVRRAFFPDDYGFYLRVYVASEHDNDRTGWGGNFDLTCPSVLASDLADIVASASRLPVAKMEAKAYFDLHYGG